MPDILNPVNVPTLVMLGCALVVTVPAVLALPVTFPTIEPPTTKFPPTSELPPMLALPVTDSEPPVDRLPPAMFPLALIFELDAIKPFACILPVV